MVNLIAALSTAASAVNPFSDFGSTFNPQYKLKSGSVASEACRRYLSSSRGDGSVCLSGLFEPEDWLFYITPFKVFHEFTLWTTLGATFPIDLIDRVNICIDNYNDMDPEIRKWYDVSNCVAAELFSTGELWLTCLVWVLLFFFVLFIAIGTLFYFYCWCCRSCRDCYARGWLPDGIFGKNVEGGVRLRINTWFPNATSQGLQFWRRITLYVLNSLFLFFQLSSIFLIAVMGLLLTMPKYYNMFNNSLLNQVGKVKFSADNLLGQIEDVLLPKINHFTPESANICSNNTSLGSAPDSNSQGFGNEYLKKKKWYTDNDLKPIPMFQSYDFKNLYDSNYSTHVGNPFFVEARFNVAECDGTVPGGIPACYEPVNLRTFSSNKDTYDLTVNNRDRLNLGISRAISESEYDYTEFADDYTQYIPKSENLKACPVTIQIFDDALMDKYAKSWSWKQLSERWTYRTSVNIVDGGNLEMQNLNFDDSYQFASLPFLSLDKDKLTVDKREDYGKFQHLNAPELQTWTFDYNPLLGYSFQDTLSGFARFLGFYRTTKNHSDHTVYKTEECTNKYFNYKSPCKFTGKACKEATDCPKQNNGCDEGNDNDNQHSGINCELANLEGEEDEWFLDFLLAQDSVPSASAQLENMWDTSSGYLHGYTDIQKRTLFSLATSVPSAWESLVSLYESRMPPNHMLALAKDYNNDSSYTVNSDGLKFLQEVYKKHCPTLGYTFGDLRTNYTKGLEKYAPLYLSTAIDADSYKVTATEILPGVTEDDDFCAHMRAFQTVSSMPGALSVKRWAGFYSVPYFTDHTTSKQRSVLKGVTDMHLSLDLTKGDNPNPGSVFLNYYQIDTPQDSGYVVRKAFGLDDCDDVSLAQDINTDCAKGLTIPGYSPDDQGLNAFPAELHAPARFHWDGQTDQAPFNLFSNQLQWLRTTLALKTSQDLVNNINDAVDGIFSAHFAFYDIIYTVSNKFQGALPVAIPSDDGKIPTLAIVNYALIGLTVLISVFWISWAIIFADIAADHKKKDVRDDIVDWKVAGHRWRGFFTCMCLQSWVYFPMALFAIIAMVVIVQLTSVCRKEALIEYANDSTDGSSNIGTTASSCFIDGDQWTRDEVVSLFCDSTSDESCGDPPDLTEILGEVGSILGLYDENIYVALRDYNLVPDDATLKNIYEAVQMPIPDPIQAVTEGEKTAVNVPKVAVSLGRQKDKLILANDNHFDQLIPLPIDGMLYEGASYNDDSFNDDLKMFLQNATTDINQWEPWALNPYDPLLQSLVDPRFWLLSMKPISSQEIDDGAQELLKSQLELVRAKAIAAITKTPYITSNKDEKRTDFFNQDDIESFRLFEEFDLETDINSAYERTLENIKTTDTISWWVPAVELYISELEERMLSKGCCIKGQSCATNSDPNIPDRFFSPICVATADGNPYIGNCTSDEDVNHIVIKPAFTGTVMHGDSNKTRPPDEYTPKNTFLQYDTQTSLAYNPSFYSLGGFLFHDRSEISEISEMQNDYYFGYTGYHARQSGGETFLVEKFQYADNLFQFFEYQECIYGEDRDTLLDPTKGTSEAHLELTKVIANLQYIQKLATQDYYNKTSPLPSKKLRRSNIESLPTSPDEDTFVNEAISTRLGTVFDANIDALNASIDVFSSLANDVNCKSVADDLESIIDNICELPLGALAFFSWSFLMLALPLVCCWCNLFRQMHYWQDLYNQPREKDMKKLLNAVAVQQINNPQTIKNMADAMYLVHRKTVPDRRKKYLYFLESNVDEHNNSCLHYACYRGFDELLNWILEQGGSANAPNAISYTPAHIAAGAGHENAIRILLSYGAQTKVFDAWNSTPFHQTIASQTITSGMQYQRTIFLLGGCECHKEGHSRWYNKNGTEDTYGVHICARNDEAYGINEEGNCCRWSDFTLDHWLEKLESDPDYCRRVNFLSVTWQNDPYAKIPRKKHPDTFADDRRPVFIDELLELYGAQDDDFVEQIKEYMILQFEKLSELFPEEFTGDFDTYKRSIIDSEIARRQEEKEFEMEQRSMDELLRNSSYSDGSDYSYGKKMASESVSLESEHDVSIKSFDTSSSSISENEKKEEEPIEDKQNTEKSSISKED